MNSVLALENNQSKSPQKTTRILNKGIKAMSPVSKVSELRTRARQKIEEGALTADYKLNVTEAVGLLNEALARVSLCSALQISLLYGFGDSFCRNRTGIFAAFQ